MKVWLHLGGISTRRYNESTKNYINNNYFGNNSDYRMTYSSTNDKKYTNIYDYMEGFIDIGKRDLAQKYFTALGRERQGMYRVHNNGVFKTLYEGSLEDS